MTEPPSLVQGQLTHVNDDDEYLLFILGLVSFSRVLLAALEKERSLAPEATPGSRREETGSLLV